MPVLSVSEDWILESLTGALFQALLAECRRDCLAAWLPVVSSYHLAKGLPVKFQNLSIAFCRIMR